MTSLSSSSVAVGTGAFLPLYNRFTSITTLYQGVANRIGDFLSTRDLLNLELSSKDTHANFMAFLSPSNKARHLELVRANKSSVIFHNLFHPDARIDNTIATLIALKEAGKALDKTHVIHGGAYDFVEKVFALLKAESWCLDEYPDILASPDALKVFAKTDYTKLMVENPNSKTVFYEILPYYIQSWNDGGDNNLSSLLGPVLLSDRAIAECLLSIEAHFFYDLSPDLQECKDLVLLACKTGIEEELLEYGQFFSQLPSRWLNDFDVMAAVCKRFGRALQYASVELQDHQDLVALSINNNGLALCFASERLQNNTQLVRDAMRNNPLAFQYASESLRSNLDLIMLALSLDANLLRYVSHYEFVLNLVASNTSFFQFISKDLAADFDFMADLCALNDHVIVESEMLQDFFYESKAFACAVVSRNGLALRCIHQKFLQDEEVVTLACQHSIEALRFVTNPKIVLSIIKHEKKAVGHINMELQFNIEFMQKVAEMIA